MKMLLAREDHTSPSRTGVIVGLVLAGILCCLEQYAARISFWQDEAFQVLNVMEQGYGQLASSLGRNQTAPPLFIMGVKACGQYLGHSEYSLRLIPLINGIAAMIVFAIVAVRSLTPRAACLAVALMAMGPKLIEHATEVKQYSGDVLAAAVLWLAASSLFGWRLNSQMPASSGDTLRQNTFRLLLFSLLAGVTFWYSEVQCFIFVGMALAVLPRFAVHRARGWLSFCAACLPGIISFLLLYLLSVRYQQNNNLIAYWIDEKGLPDYARWWMLPVWLVMSLVRLCNYFSNPLGPIVLVFAIAGVRALWSKRDQHETLRAVFLPAALTLMAALALRYPFGGSRATMFLVPSLILLCSVGFAYLQDHLPRLASAAAIAACLLVGSNIVQAAYHLAVPRSVSHPRPAIEYVRTHRTPGQGIWVPHGGSWDSFLCYWHETDSLIWGPGKTPIVGSARQFWLVVEFAPDQGLAKRQPQRDQAAQYGKPIDQFVGTGGAAFLYQCPSAAE